MSEWTHVDASMPDSDTDVIIHTEDGEVGAGYHDGLDWRWLSGGVVNIATTHWMAFPKPPVKEAA
jgi:hypothetical protein